MSNSPKQRGEWIPCPPGKLAKLAGQECVRQRRHFLVRVGSVAGVVAVAAGAGWFAFRGRGMTTEPNFGGIVCSRVRELAPQYMMGQLDPAVSQQIKTHLEQCVACRTLLESMQPKMSARSPHGGSTGRCQCSTCRRDGLVQLLATADSQKATPAT
jgi:hypothetical protein